MSAPRGRAILARPAAGWRPAAVVVLLAWPLLAARLDAAPPVVIVASEIPVYEQALAGVRGKLDGATVVRPGASPGAIAGADVVVAIGAGALATAAGARSQAPIVAALVPESAPELASVKQREVHVVGLYAPPDALLGYLAKLVPGARNLWAIYSPQTAALVSRLQVAVAGAGRTLSATEVADAGEGVRALARPPAAVDAVVMLPDPVVRNGAFDEALLRLAFERRWPVVGVSRFDVRAGALCALQLDPETIGAQAGELARRILARQGTPAGAVPPSGYKLVLNAAAAQRLGIAIPPDLRREAAEIVGQ